MKKIIKFFKNNFLGFIIGVVLCSSIGVIAATIQSNSVSYTTNKNSSITNVKQAVDDLYEKTTKVTYKYFRPRSSPYSYSNVTYPSYAVDQTSELVEKYSYIRARVVNQFAIGYDTCLWYNNHEFCISPGQFTGTLTEIKNKLRTAMETTLGTSATVCDDRGSWAMCQFGSALCKVYPSNNRVECSVEGLNCGSDYTSASCS